MSLPGRPGRYSRPGALWAKICAVPAPPWAGGRSTTVPGPRAGQCPERGGRTPAGSPLVCTLSFLQGCGGEQGLPHRPVQLGRRVHRGSLARLPAEVAVPSCPGRPCRSLCPVPELPALRPGSHVSVQSSEDPAMPGGGSPAGLLWCALPQLTGTLSAVMARPQLWAAGLAPPGLQTAAFSPRPSTDFPRSTCVLGLLCVPTFPRLVRTPVWNRAPPTSCNPSRMFKDCLQTTVPS